MVQLSISNIVIPSKLNESCSASHFGKRLNLIRKLEIHTAKDSIFGRNN